MEYIGWIDGTTYDTADTPQSTFRLRAGPCSAVQQRAGRERADRRPHGPSRHSKSSRAKNSRCRCKDGRVQSGSRTAAGRVLGYDRCPCRWSRWPWLLRPHAAGTPSRAAKYSHASLLPAALWPATIRRQSAATHRRCRAHNSSRRSCTACSPAKAVNRIRKDSSLTRRLRTAGT